MAAEEKKPKIDLKARLGKTQVGVAPAPAAPVAPTTGRHSASSVPGPPSLGASIAPAAPPPFAGVGVTAGSSPSAAPAAVGVPLPPFAGQSKPPADPFAGVGVTAGSSPSAAPVAVGVPLPPFAGQSKPPADPFGGVSIAPAARAQPQTFKIELDEETMRAARKGGKRGAILGTIMGLGGLAVGFAWGGRSESAKGADTALEGAQSLVTEVTQAQEKIKALSEKIAGAVKDLKDKKFPESFASELGGLSIPFGPDKLAGRNIGRFDQNTLRLLFSYTNDVESLNDRKDALRNIFTGQKKAIVDTLGAGGSPKVGWSVFIQKSPAHGPVAILAPINPNDAFSYKDANWPGKFKISNGREFVDTDRYMSGDVTSTEKKVVAVPLDPDSVAGAFPNDVLSRITSELVKTETVLVGGGGPNGDDDSGVLKKGDQLLTALKRIGQK